MHFFPFAVGILFLSILSPIIGQGENSRSLTALILYPKAALSYFQRMNTRPNCECVSEFKTLSRECRRNVCMEFLADAVPFHVSSETLNFVKGDLRTLIEETYETIPEPFIDELSFRAADGTTHRTPGQWCIKKDGRQEQWAMSTGLHQGVMLVYKNHSSDFELLALSEEIPYFHRQMSQQELDRRYITGTYHEDDSVIVDSLSVPENPKTDLNASVPHHLDELVKSMESDEEDESDSFESLNDEQQGEPTELCSLNSYERLRVCAVSYLALYRRENLLHPELDNETHERKDGENLKHPKPNGVLQESNVLQDEPTCVLGVIDVDSKELSSVPPLEVVGALSCLLNAKTHPTQLLLVNDRYTTNSVFVVEDSPDPLDVSADGTPRRSFKLKYFLTNLRVLKPFDVTF